MAYNPNPQLVTAIRSSGASYDDQVIALATSLVESGGRLDAVGDHGQSFGPYQEYTGGRGAGIAPAQRMDPVASTQRFLRELATFRARGFTGGELAYRTQRPADHGGYVAKVNQAIPVARGLLGGAVGKATAASGSSLPPGASPGLRGPAAPTDSPAGPSGLRLTPALERKLSAYIDRTSTQVMAGLIPDDPFEIAQGLAATAVMQGPLMDYQGRVRRQPPARGASQGAIQVQPGQTFGFKTGSVDSGLVDPGGAGGDWGGSMERALAVAHAVGATPSSQKRSRKLTASGNPSDHWVGMTQSYAVDLPTSGAAGDALFARIRQAIGQNIRPGTWNNVNIGGYRYQIGWRVPGHYDHIHVGVRKL
jgi:hypothetical protein